MKEKPELVMSSFNALNGTPLNGHTEMLIDVLRKKWGFDGVLISDYYAIVEMIAHGFCENEEACAEISINNEVDIEMVSPSYMHCLPKLVKEGKVSEEKVNKMLRRVLELKEKAGLFENQYGKADEELENKLCLCPEHRNIARDAAEKAIVLLKNNGILPLSESDRVCVTGHMADEKDVMGDWRCHGKKEDCVSFVEGITNLLGHGVSETDGDIAVACIGEKSEMCGESASKVDINVSREDVALVKELHEKGKRVVAVVFAGRPLVLSEIEPYCDAIVYAWFLGSESGNAIANVLYGKALPSAKLTMSFPRAVGQCPLYYNNFSTGRPKRSDDYHMIKDFRSGYIDEFNSPLYPFGYGLTYADIKLSDLVLSSNEISENGSIKVSVLAENCGNYDGEEVVQLYIQDKFGSVVRPVKELKGYQKVFLKKGESKRVEFTLTEEALRFYKTKNELISEVGEFNLFVGLNSRDTLNDKFTRV
jgi:beta-glucosidase